MLLMSICSFIMVSTATNCGNLHIFNGICRSIWALLHLTLIFPDCTLTNATCIQSVAFKWLWPPCLWRTSSHCMFGYHCKPAVICISFLWMRSAIPTISNSCRMCSFTCLTLQIFLSTNIFNAISPFFRCLSFNHILMVEDPGPLGRFSPYSLDLCRGLCLGRLICQYSAWVSGLGWAI